MAFLAWGEAANFYPNLTKNSLAQSNKGISPSGPIHVC